MTAEREIRHPDLEHLRTAVKESKEINRFPTEEELKKFLGRRFKFDREQDEWQIRFIHKNRETGRTLKLSFPRVLGSDFFASTSDGPYIVIGDIQSVNLLDESPNLRYLGIKSNRSSFSLNMRGLEAYYYSKPQTFGRDDRLHLPFGRLLKD